MLYNSNTFGPEAIFPVGFKVDKKTDVLFEALFFALQYAAAIAAAMIREEVGNLEGGSHLRFMAQTEFHLINGVKYLSR